MLILGSEAMQRKDAGAILELAQAVSQKSKVRLHLMRFACWATRVAFDVVQRSRPAPHSTPFFTRQANSDSWKVFNFLQRKAGQVAALDLGYKSTPVKPGKSFVYLLQSDDFDAEALKGAFVVYQGASIVFIFSFGNFIFVQGPPLSYQPWSTPTIGSHGDKGAAVADVILPGAAYTEKDATFVNTEGRVQTTRTAVTPPGKARVDWEIIRALSEVRRHDRRSRRPILLSILYPCFTTLTYRQLCPH